MTPKQLTAAEAEALNLATLKGISEGTDFLTLHIADGDALLYFKKDTAQAASNAKKIYDYTIGRSWVRDAAHLELAFQKLKKEGQLEKIDPPTPPPPAVAEVEPTEEEVAASFAAANEFPWGARLKFEDLAHLNSKKMTAWREAGWGPEMDAQVIQAQLEAGRSYQKKDILTDQEREAVNKENDKYSKGVTR